MKNKVVSIIKKVLPAVVSITCSKFLEKAPVPFSSFTQGLFGPSSPPLPQNFNPFKKEKIKIGGGSGFIVDKNGIIFTNRHVVENSAAEYFVFLQNNEKFKPEIIAKDPINDVAILKIEKDNLPTIPLGDSNTLELGEDVIAIGNALGLFRNTVSTGIISGLSRAIIAQNSSGGEKTRLRGLIQTDAAINPGNSGGPLVNLKGEAIGINAAMVYGAENIGFALPINNAKKDLEELKKYGRIRQPFLGLRYVSIDQELKDRLNLPIEYGALVISEPNIYGFENAVIPGSPAAKAGIKEADIIVEFANKKIDQEQTLSDILAECEIGKELPLKILRHNKEKVLKIVLVERNQ